MNIRSRDFVGKAEKIKSTETRLESEIRSISSNIFSLKSEKSYIMMNISSLNAELSAAYCDTDEEGNIDYGRVSSLQIQIEAAESRLASVSSEISIAESELSEKKSSLEITKEEKAQTLFEIERRAKKTSENIDYASGMCGSYARIGSQLSNNLTGSLNTLSQAANILGGSVSTSTGGGSGRGVSTSSSVSRSSISGGSVSGSGGSDGSSSKVESSKGNSSWSNKGLLSKSLHSASVSFSKYSFNNISGSISLVKNLGVFSKSDSDTASSFQMVSQQHSNSDIQCSFNSSKSGKSSKNTVSSSKNTARSSKSTAQNNNSIAKGFRKSSSSGKSKSKKSSEKGSVDKRWAISQIFYKSDLSMSPMERLSAYMNEHNYGIKDYDIYSKDPEWITLHKAVYHKKSSSYSAHEKACSDYKEWQDKGGSEMPYTKTSYTVNVSSKSIFGVRGAEDSGFWEYKRHSKQDYVDMARQIPIVRQYLRNGMSLEYIISKGGIVGACAANYFQSPIKVGRYKDSYIHIDDGRHRIEAAKIAGVDIPVTVVEFYGFQFNEIVSFEEKLEMANKNSKVLKWQGNPGNSVRVPKDSNGSLAKELKKYGISGIEYKKGNPDFSPISCFNLKFDNFPALYTHISNIIVSEKILKKDGSLMSRSDFNNTIRSIWQSVAAEYVFQKLKTDGNFANEFERKTGIKVSSIGSANALKNALGDNGLTMHETNDCSQIQFVSTSIHSAFKHAGGVCEMLEHLFDPYSHLIDY